MTASCLQIGQPIPKGGDPITTLSNLDRMSEAEKALLDLYLDDNAIWRPQSGPQTEAYLSTADELFYGGSAGGG